MYILSSSNITTIQHFDSGGAMTIYKLYLVKHITSVTGSIPVFPSCRHDLVRCLRASSRSDCFTARACQELSYAHPLSTNQQHYA